jgi:hypothetical protein
MWPAMGADSGRGATAGDQVEPPYYFVRDRASRVAHHWDYERERTTRALCGHEYAGEILFEGGEQPSRVCRSCQQLLPPFEARWWRDSAKKSLAQLASLKERYADLGNQLRQSRSHVDKLSYQLGLCEGRNESLKKKVANQRNTLHQLQDGRSAANRAKKSVQSRPANATPVRAERKGA